MRETRRLRFKSTTARAATISRFTTSPPHVAGFFMRGRMGGMRFRKLRIAWSVVCGIACVLLIALWLRSYYVSHSLRGGVAGRFHLSSQVNRGTLIIAVYDVSAHTTDESWVIESDPIFISPMAPPVWKSFFVFFVSLKPLAIAFPSWLAVAGIASISILPWFRYLPWQYRL